MFTKKPYQYSPLEAGEIRLLKLLPGVGDDEVTIDLIHQATSSELQYEALSYVWGSSEDTGTIIVTRPQSSRTSRLVKRVSKVLSSRNDGTLAIRRNLVVALQHLRKTDQPRAFWIDAICINQNDEEEKGREVAKMGDIYRSARRVVVWLGEKSEDSSLAVSALKKIGKDVTYEPSGLVVRLILKSNSDLERLEKSPQDMIAALPSWNAISRLFDRPWFTRLWVLQEIGLASAAVVVVGSDEIQWQDFRGALVWIYGSKRTLSPFFNAHKFEIVHPFVLQMRSRGLCDLSIVARHMNCLDPRDRIYAILSLLSPEVVSRIKPDYSRPAAPAYTDAVRADIEGYDTLEILSLCSFPDPAISQPLTPRPPSWVPDLSHPSSFGAFDFLSFATGISDPETYFDKVEGTLAISGRLGDTITYVSAPMPSDISPQDVIKVCREWEPADAYTADYPAGGRLIDAFVTTISGLYSRDVLYLKARSPRTSELLEQYENSVNNDKLDDQAPSQFPKDVRSYLKGKSMFRTEKGYIGACPPQARRGDRVCVTLGCFFPLLLRPVPGKEGHYQAGGACFVPGLDTGAGLCGLLPPGWTQNFGLRKGSEMMEFCSPDGERTELDPRPGPFPADWEARNAAIRGNGSRDGRIYYSNKKTKETTYSDPRLTSKNLKTIGIELDEIILV